METTFMTIHNLSPEANILYASESIVDILGFQPAEVVGKSCFEYFHPEEIPFARTIHIRSVQMDKAASLHYARIQNREGQWVGCECVFTIVYEVLVACTSIYRGDAKNERRALEAPAIRRLFASSPRDPRYHMLEHLSAKFRTPVQDSLLEPRAALILNRFTRTLTVMYATNAVSKILGITPDQFKDKSFYECMQENCLPEAIRCLESAKANDSIAYLRFWYRDPRGAEGIDEDIDDDSSGSSDSEDGGVALSSPMELDSAIASNKITSAAESGTSDDDKATPTSEHPNILQSNYRISSGESTDLEQDSAHAMFDRPANISRSFTSESSVYAGSPERRRERVSSPRAAPEPYELEAVVSCTSDGLVVVLRRARPLIPSLEQPIPMHQRAQGLFAAPWGANPIRPHFYQPNQQYPFQHGLLAPQLPMGGPPLDEFMNSIREVAVFAWSLTGINGNIASYGHGTPSGEALPPGGLPVWDPYSQPNTRYLPPENQAARRWARWNEKRNGTANAPYQHAQQEADPRHQNGYGPEQVMGADREASMGQASLNGHPVFPYAPEIQAPQLGLGPLTQSGWQATVPANAGVHTPPNQYQVQGPSGGSTGGNRYLWQ